jgi:hypothetical protein
MVFLLGRYVEVDLTVKSSHMLDDNLKTAMIVRVWNKEQVQSSPRKSGEMEERHIYRVWRLSRRREKSNSRRKLVDEGN